MAVAKVAGALDHGAEIMVINKFGKHEAEGRGFRAVIAAAMDKGVPVLVGLNPLNREAFDHFACGLATELSADLDAILKWAAIPPTNDKHSTLSANTTRHRPDLSL